MAVRERAKVPLRKVDHRQRAQLSQYKRGACYVKRYVGYEYRW